MARQQQRDAEYGDDTAHGYGNGVKGSHDASDSNLATGTILGKKGSQVPLVQIEHTGMPHDLKEACLLGRKTTEPDIQASDVCGRGLACNTSFMRHSA